MWNNEDILPIEWERIGVWSVGNYYWWIYIMHKQGKFYWIIEDWDTDFDDLEQRKEISKELFLLLYKEESDVK